MDFVLFSIIDGMADKYLLVNDALELRVNDLEEASLQPDLDKGILAESARLRCELMETRQLAISQRGLLTPIARGA